MKALTFEQYFKAYEGKEMSLLPKANWSEILKKYLQTLHEFHDFVSQPFKPEMVTEFFVGFKQKTKDFIRNDNDFLIIISNNHIEIWRSFSHLSKTRPKTLNDFISDCNRAGIELEWKEGVI